MKAPRVQIGSTRAGKRGLPTRKHVLALIGILLLCAGLRFWLAHRAEVIAKDGVIYLEMARRWSAEPVAVVNEYDYPPGYPVATVGMHRVLLRLGLADGRRLWELSGQAVSVVSSLAAMVAIWAFAGIVLGWRIATITVLLFGVSKKWSCLGSDVVSDSLAICLQLWAVVLVLKGLSLLRRRSKWAVAAAAAVGAVVGAGYLVRPESLWVGLLAMAVWLGRCVMRRVHLRLTLASVVVMVAGVAAVGGPYVKATGALSNKQSVRRIVGGVQPVDAPTARGEDSAGDSAAPQPAAEREGIAWAAAEFAGQFLEAMHPILGSACLVWMLVLAARLLLGNTPVGSLLPVPNNAGKAVMLAAAGIVLPILAVLHVTVGYVSHRHISFLAALLSPLSSACIVFLAAVLSLRLRPLGGVARRASLVTNAMVLGVFVALAATALQRPHENKAYVRQAGLYICSIAMGADVLLADNAWTAHYAGIPYRLLDPHSVTADGFWREMERKSPPVTIVALSQRHMAEAARRNPVLADVCRDGRLTKIKEFLQAGENPDTIAVYRVGGAGQMPSR